MFGKFKEKLKEWANKITKKEEEKAPEEEIDVETKADKKKILKKAKEKVEKTKEREKEKVDELVEEENQEELKEVDEKQKKEQEKIDTIVKEIDKESTLITVADVKGINSREVKQKEKKPLKQKEVIEITVKEEIKPEKQGFFGKLKEKFKGKEKEIIVEKQEEIEEKEEGIFSKLKSKITKIKISEQDFEEYKEDLKMLMLENNVAYEVVDIIIFKLKQKIVGKEILKKELESEIRDSLRDTIESILIEPFDLIDKITDKQEKPYVILFCGINGTGKTTTIAKLAYMFQRKHLSCILAGADTFRAASIEQIKKHGEKLGVKVIAHDYGSDPASVGFDAINYGKKNKIDVVLIDTAGRMHTEKNLLKEIEKISRVCKPDTKIFIGEATTGNDSIEQIRAFDSAIGIDGIILTKADTDEKGGTALSVGQVTRKPILYLGTGQEYDKLELFNKKKFTERLGL